jgi:hypothetical protein
MKTEITALNARLTSSSDDTLTSEKAKAVPPAPSDKGTDSLASVASDTHYASELVSRNPEIRGKALKAQIASLLRGIDAPQWRTHGRLREISQKLRAPGLPKDAYVELDHNICITKHGLRHRTTAFGPSKAIGFAVEEGAHGFKLMSFRRAAVDERCLQESFYFRHNLTSQSIEAAIARIPQNPDIKTDAKSELRVALGEAAVVAPSVAVMLLLPPVTLGFWLASLPDRRKEAQIKQESRERFWRNAGVIDGAAGSMMG